MLSKVESWKQAKHGFDVWPDVERYAGGKTPMDGIDEHDLERMKWYGVFYRKRDEDGRYMLRLRITNGEMTTAQAKEIAYIAYQYGHGIIDLTTRANIQLQGLEIQNVPRALARLEEVGLTTRQTGHDNIRNIFGHPLAGLDPEEIVDTRPLCSAVTSLFMGSRVYSDLPRKFNIAFCGKPHASLHYWTQDISFLATHGPDGEPAFQVLIGGKQGQRPFLGQALPVLVPPERCVEFVRCLLDLFRAQGPREKRDESRFCFLLEKIGVAGVLDWLDKHLETPLPPSIAAPVGPSGHDDLVGWYAQKQPGRWTMGLCIPAGRLAWDQLEGIAVAAKRWGSGHLRNTTDQGLAIVDVPTGFKDSVATAAARYGLSPIGDTVSRGVVCCTGKQFCNIAVTETKSHALALIDSLRQRTLALHGIRVHMSGCPAACAMHHTADIGLKGVRVRRLLGTVEGFDVFLAGGVNSVLHLGLPYRSGVDAEQLPQLIQDVVQEYYLKHVPGQTFSAYWRERLREQEGQKAGEGDFRAPVWECDRCQHHYHGEDPPVFCPQCASLRRHFARLETTASTKAHPASNGIAKPHVSATAPSQQVAIPAAPEGFSAAVSLADIPAAGSKIVTLAGREVALFREGDRVFAVENACPHAGGSLGEGTCTSGTVTCPLHQWEFDAATGANRNAKRAGIAAFEVKIVESMVFLREKAPQATI